MIKEKVMGKKEGLMNRLQQKPEDFTLNEMESLLLYFEYRLKQNKTGSGVKFAKNRSGEVINFHRPHPAGVLKRYVSDQGIEKLREDGLI